MDTPNSTVEIKLITEQMARFHDRFESRLKQIDERLSHSQILTAQQLETLRTDIQSLRSSNADHETRLRSLNDSTVAFRTWSSLFSGSSLIAALSALVRTFFP